MSVAEAVYQFFGPQRLSQLVHISLKDGYVFFANQKAASTAVSAALGRAALRDFSEAEVAAHLRFSGDPHIKPYHLDSKQLDECLTGSDLLRFAFVRNPYDRLVAGFLDLIQGNHPMKANILALVGKPTVALDVDVKFATYIGALSEVSDRDVELPWMAQTRATCAHWLKLDWVGQVENFRTDLRKLGRRLDLPFSEFVAPRKPAKQNIADASESLWTKALKKKAARRYAGDFLRFGYDPDA